MKTRPRCGRHRLFRQVYLHGLLLLFVSGIALAVLAVWPGPGLPEHLRERVPAQLIAADLGPRLGSRAALEAELAQLQRILGADLAVYGADGALLGRAGRRPPPPLGPVQARSIGEWRFVRAGRVGALAIGLPGGAYGLVTRHPAWRTRFLLFVAAVLILGALLSLPVARAISRPLERLTETSRRLAAGDFSARSGIVRDDEVGALAAAMDEMAAGIETRIIRERELLGNVSHELRTPLARLRVALEIAAESDDPDEVRKHLAGIASDVGELDRLVGDVLAVSRLDAARENVRIAPAAARFEEIAAGAAERFRRGHPGRELRLEIAADLPGLTVDATLIGRALDNLLENAVRYADQAQPVVLRGYADGGTLVVAVADRGVGVSPEDLPRLFEPFFRAERSRSRDAGGTGLGLTLCKRIVEAHGGSIAAAANPGGGLVVTMRIPLPEALRNQEKATSHGAAQPAS
jgi:signal transduction histidine kinase